MRLALIAKKVGMTQIFTDDGAALPVTVLEVLDKVGVRVVNPEHNTWPNPKIISLCGQASGRFFVFAAGKPKVL